MRLESNDAFARLSRAIQDRKVILWAGAGLSGDAGYPTGTDLANLLLERLGEPQDTREALSSVAERFRTTARGREELEQLLKELFSEGRESRIHQQIAAINRFPYIITTNYDPLFEDAFGDDLLVIRNQSELSGTASAGEKTVLYKIHGDARRPETIVITESDYRRLDESSLLWDALRTRLAEYSILFIGYSLRDPNTVKHLQTVLARLGKHANPYYLIDLKTDGIVPKELADASIELIEMFAVEAIDGIYDYICDVAVSESKNSASLWTNRRLFHLNNLLPTFKATSSGLLKNVVYRIEDRSRPFSSRGALRSTLPPESELGRHFLGLMEGSHFEDVEIGEEYDPQLEIWVNRLRITGLEKFRRIKISRKPNEKYRVDLQLTDDPTLRLGNVHLNVFYSETHYKFEISDRWFTLSFFGPKVSQNGTFSMTESLRFRKLMPNVERAKVIFSLLDSWYEGAGIDVIRHDGDSSFQLPGAVTSSTEPIADILKDLRDLYDDLDEIERKARVKFNPRKAISTTDRQRIGDIAALLRGEKRPLDTITGTMSRINREAFREMTQRTIGHLRLTGDNLNGVKILNKAVIVPFVVEGRLVELVNYEEMMARFDEGANEIAFLVERGRGELYMKYDPSHDAIQNPMAIGDLGTKAGEIDEGS